MATARVLCVALILLSASGFAQNKKIPVQVVHTGADTVGAGIAYQLKQDIASSQTMRLEDSAYVPRMKAVIVSLDMNASSPGARSALSVSIVFDSIDSPLGGLFLTAYVQTCPISQVQICSQSILAVVDKQIDYLRTNVYAVQIWSKLSGLGDAKQPTSQRVRPNPPKPKPRQPENPF